MTRLCSGGDIFDKVIEVGAFTEDQAQILFIQLLRAIFYYNDFYIVHRDLKPENFLFQARDKLSALYMIDFGCASKNTRGIQLLQEKVGTVSAVSSASLGLLHSSRDNRGLVLASI